MTSYKGLLNKIEAFCNAHLQIKKYGGEFKEQMPNFSTENEKYPIVYVVPTSDLSDLNTNQFTLDVYCVDIIQKDRANINTIVSDCNLIVNDLYLYFLDGNDLSIDVVGASSGSPINNFDLDYSAGWVKSITFEVQAYSVCAIPMNPINPNPPVECLPATVNFKTEEGDLIATIDYLSGSNQDQKLQNVNAVNSDESFIDSVPYGNTVILPDITVTDSDGSTYTQPSVIDVVCTYVPPSEDATVNVNGAFWDSVPSGGTENVIVRQSSGSTEVGSIQGQYFRIADSTAVLKTTGGTTISTTSIKAEASANIVAPNTTIEVNGTTEGTVVAGATVDIQLSDSGGVVTPTSITQVGNDLQVVLPPNVQLYNSAELTRTGQTVSYAVGDDGDLEKGRGGSFFLLPYNSPFGNTNRFTSDNFSAQTTYTNNIVIDWSTYNGSTVLGYKRTIMATANWATQISNCNALSFGGYTSGWRLCNVQEYQNIANYSLSQTFNYAPFNLSTSSYQHTSTTDPGNTNSALKFYNPGGWCLGDNKLNTATAIACRTFTVTGTTLS